MFILFHPYIIFLIGLLITTLFIVGLFKEKQLKDELGIDYNNYYDRYNVIREKNPKTKQGSQSSPVKIKIEKTVKSKSKDFPLGIPQCGTDALRFCLMSYMM